MTITIRRGVLRTKCGIGAEAEIYPVGEVREQSEAVSECHHQLERVHRPNRRWIPHLYIQISLSDLLGFWGYLVFSRILACAQLIFGNSFVLLALFYKCGHYGIDLLLADDWFENWNHDLTSTVILSCSVPRNGPCLMLIHCISSMTRIACTP